MIVAAVQVRMNSMRLPGKALAEVVGRPMLWHIVNRLRFARRLDQVIIATSDEQTDAPIRVFADQHRIPCVAGSERDVIDRLCRSARHFGADVLVRITGDCPLVDPHVVDDMIAVYLAHTDQVDYVTNTLPPTYPDGLDAEVYPMATLERLWRELNESFWREWFVGYLTEHQETFRVLNVAHSVDLSALRWTVDYEEDLVFVRKVYERLYREDEFFDLGDVVALLEAEPAFTGLNAMHARNEGYAIALAAYRRM